MLSSPTILRTGMPLIAVKTIVFGILGVLYCGILLVATCRLLKEKATRDERLWNVFLIGWLLFEIMGAFALSPFQAARHGWVRSWWSRFF